MKIIGKTAKPKQAQGFRAGLAQVRIGDYTEVRKALMTALGVSNRNSLSAYTSGRQEMKITQAAAVERVFHKYGVTENIWGNEFKCRANKA